MVYRNMGLALYTQYHGNRIFRFTVAVITRRQAPEAKRDARQATSEKLQTYHTVVHHRLA